MPAIGELFRATISLQSQGGLCQNVLHFRGDTGVEESQDLLDVLEGAYWPAYRAVLPISTTILGINVQQLTPLVRDPVSGVPIDLPGTIPTAEVNSQCATILTLRTGFASRRQRGRIYLAPVPANLVQINQLTPEGRTLYTTFKNEILTNFNDDTGISSFTLGVYSRLEGGDGPTYSVAGWTAVTQIDVQSILGAQRRRRLGRGA